MPHIHELYDFTASAFIFHPTEDKVCLHFHKKLNSWLQPGGHIELNEDPHEAIVHELQEETGLQAKDYTIIELTEQPKPRGAKTIPLPFNINVHPFDDKHKHIDFSFLVQSKTDTLKPAEGESKQIGWFALKQVRDLHKNDQLYDGTLDIIEWLFANYKKSK